jgi:hypothetical protein
MRVALAGKIRRQISFFLASFAIHIQHWPQMDREVSDLKRSY